MKVYLNAKSTAQFAPITTEKKQKEKQKKNLEVWRGKFSGQISNDFTSGPIAVAWTACCCLTGWVL